MINKISLDTLWRVKFQPVTLPAVGLSATFVLSVFHHLLNFWGLSWEKQLLIVALIPLMGIPIHFLVVFLWQRSVTISGKRWLFFLLPVLAIASFVTWRLYKSPVVWHSIEITAMENSGRKQVQLLEIRDSSGAVVKFSQIQDVGDWALQDNMLTTAGAASRPLRYSFAGPFRDPVTFRFLTSPTAGDVEIKVDGRSVQASLFDPQNGQRVIRMEPRYRIVFPATVMIALVVVIDFLALLSLFTILWLVQEIHQTAQPAIETDPRFLQGTYWKYLGILLAISFVLHAINYFSVPLQVGGDSPGYLDGAVHWAKYHNLEGASSVRGPGTSFVFLPAILFFGRNPWGIKLLLHLLAFASVALTYHLGWQLTKKLQFAFLAGLLTALNPDIFFFSNSVMSEIPNMFFVLLFCILLLLALETISFRSILATMLVGSFTVLIRTENLVLILLAVLFLIIRVAQTWSAQRQLIPARDLFPQIAASIKQIGFTALLAALPILAWSTHNYQQHGFFGLSNYAAEVLYTGWVYEAQASHITFTDQSSPAVKIINEAYWNDPDVAKEPGAATGWTIYHHMLERGFESDEIFTLLRQAALDSITNDYRKTWQVIVVKIHDSFKPLPSDMITFSLPGEATGTEISRIKAAYFDDEKFVIPPLVLMQRRIYEFVAWFYISMYPSWAWFCVGAMLLCLYRKPVLPWLPIVLITLFRVGLPNFYGLSVWRFVVPGLPLIQILALAALQSVFFVGRMMLRTYKKNAAHSFAAK